MRITEQAICLRATDFSETSQILAFLTRGGGLVRVIGKGTKRPKSKSGGMIDLLSEGQLVYSPGRGEALSTLIEFTESVSHTPLRSEATRLNVSLYMLEAVGALVGEGDVHAEVFDLLHNALLRLGQAGAPAGAVMAYFQWRLLRHVGLLGQLTRCVTCGGAPSRTASVFSSTMGGVLCSRCAHGAPDKTPVDQATLAAADTLAAAESGKRSELTPTAAARINRLLAYHISQQLGRKLKMARYALGAPGK